jgi:hypothetical protein
MPQTTSGRSLPATHAKHVLSGKGSSATCLRPSHRCKQRLPGSGQPTGQDDAHCILAEFIRPLQCIVSILWCSKCYQRRGLKPRQAHVAFKRTLTLRLGPCFHKAQKRPLDGPQPRTPRHRPEGPPVSLKRIDVPAGHQRPRLLVCSL